MELDSNDKKLKEELKIYSKRYESELRSQGMDEEKINKKVNDWVDQTFQFYKESNISSEDATRIFQFLNISGAEPQTETVSESPKARR